MGLAGEAYGSAGRLRGRVARVGCTIQRSATTRNGVGALPITEVFPYPTVKQVIFQIRFPDLFYLESRIGELQLRVMREFPEPRLIHQQQVLLVGRQTGGAQNVEPPGPGGGSGVTEIWQFSSPKGYQLQVATSSLSIHSEHHKTYRNEGADKFRDVIKGVLGHFFALAPLPVVSRVGLRYIDRCPVPDVDNDVFTSYYRTVFPLSRFGLHDAEEMVFATTVAKAGYHLRYREAFRRPLGSEAEYVLDFDAYATDVLSGDCLAVTDSLHEIVSEEFERTAKDPLYQYMRRGGLQP